MTAVNRYRYGTLASGPLASGSYASGSPATGFLATGSLPTASNTDKADNSSVADKENIKDSAISLNRPPNWGNPWGSYLVPQRPSSLTRSKKPLSGDPSKVKRADTVAHKPAVPQKKDLPPQPSLPRNSTVPNLRIYDSNPDWFKLPPSPEKDISSDHLSDWERIERARSLHNSSLTDLLNVNNPPTVTDSMEKQVPNEKMAKTPSLPESIMDYDTDSEEWFDADPGDVPKQVVVKNKTLTDKMGEGELKLSDFDHTDCNVPKRWGAIPAASAYNRDDELPQILDIKTPDVKTLMSLSSRTGEGYMNKKRAYIKVVEAVESIGAIPEVDEDDENNFEAPGQTSHININRRITGEDDPIERLPVNMHAAGARHYRVWTDGDDIYDNYSAPDEEPKLYKSTKEKYYDAKEIEGKRREAEHARAHGIFTGMKSPESVRKISPAEMRRISAEHAQTLVVTEGTDDAPRTLSRSPAVAGGLNLLAANAPLDPPEDGLESPQEAQERIAAAQMTSPEAVAAFAKNSISPEPSSPTGPESPVRPETALGRRAPDSPTSPASPDSESPVKRNSNSDKIYVQKQRFQDSSVNLPVPPQPERSSKIPVAVSPLSKPKPAPKPSSIPVPISPLSKPLPVLPRGNTFGTLAATPVRSTPIFHSQTMGGDALNIASPIRLRDRMAKYVPKGLKQTPAEEGALRQVSDWYKRTKSRIGSNLGKAMKSDKSTSDLGKAKRLEKVNTAMMAAQDVDKDREEDNKKRAHRRKSSSDTLKAAQGQIGARKKSVGTIAEPKFVNGA